MSKTLCNSVSTMLISVGVFGLIASSVQVGADDEMFPCEADSGFPIRCNDNAEVPGGECVGDLQGGCEESAAQDKECSDVYDWWCHTDDTCGETGNPNATCGTANYPYITYEWYWGCPAQRVPGGCACEIKTDYNFSIPNSYQAFTPGGDSCD